MNGMKALFMAGLLFSAASAIAEMPTADVAMSSLDDSQLADVNGGEGITVGLEFYYNAQKATAASGLDGQPIGATTSASTDLGSCTGTLNPCRTAWQFANRGSRTVTNPGGSSQTLNGQWLTFKDSWMALQMPNLNLNGGFLGAALSGAAGYTGFFDATRFQTPSGTCLLSNGSGGSACTVANLQQTPSLVMSHAATTTSYDQTGKKSSGYNSIGLDMNIGRLAIEYDCTTVNSVSCPTVTNTLGYNRDVNGSFLGLGIHDNNSNFAGIAVGGKMYMYGF